MPTHSPISYCKGQKKSYYQAQLTNNPAEAYCTVCLYLLYTHTVYFSLCRDVCVERFVTFAQQLYNFIIFVVQFCLQKTES